MSVVASRGTELRYPALAPPFADVARRLLKLLVTLAADERLKAKAVHSRVFSMRKNREVIQPVIQFVSVDVVDRLVETVWFSVRQPPHDVRAKRVSRPICAGEVGTKNAEPSRIYVTIIPTLGRPGLPSAYKSSLLCSSHR